MGNERTTGTVGWDMREKNGYPKSEERAGSEGWASRFWSRVCKVSPVFGCSSSLLSHPPTTGRCFYENVLPVLPDSPFVSRATGRRARNLQFNREDRARMKSARARETPRETTRLCVRGNVPMAMTRVG